MGRPFVGQGTDKGSVFNDPPSAPGFWEMKTIAIKEPLWRSHGPRVVNLAKCKENALNFLL